MLLQHVIWLITISSSRLVHCCSVYNGSSNCEDHGSKTAAACHVAHHALKCMSCSAAANAMAHHNLKPLSGALLPYVIWVISCAFRLCQCASKILRALCAGSIRSCLGAGDLKLSTVHTPSRICRPVQLLLNLPLKHVCNLRLSQAAVSTMRSGS